MKTTTFKFLAGFSLLVTILYACGNGKPELFRVDPAYGKYVSGYTSGMVSRTAGIRIDLDDSTLKNVDLKNKELLKDIFQFEPEIKGQAYWNGKHAIEFIPDDNLPVGQFYTVTFDLQRVANVDYGHEEFKFQFATYTQHMYVESEGLKNYNEEDIEWQYLEGTVTTTDFEDSSALIETLTANYNGKKLPIRLLDAYDEHAFTFIVDSIERTDKQGKVELFWDGKPINSMSKGKLAEDVVELGNFSLTDVTVIDHDDQSLNLIFSEPILADQDLTGFIRIEGQENLTFSVDNNNVSVYLPNRTVGRKYLEVFAGIKNFKGHKMLRNFQRFVQFEEPKPRVRIVGSGNILPNSQGLIFPFETIGLKAVDLRIMRIFENNVHHFLQVNDLNGSDELTRFGKVIFEKKIFIDQDKNMNFKQWSKHVVDLGKYINPQPGAIYRISIKFRKDYTTCDCPVNPISEESSEDDDYYEEEEEVDPNWNENLWSSWFYNDEYENWDDYYDEDPVCSDDYYRGKGVSKNILASDLGMIFKLDEDKTGHAFVTNMLTTEPMVNVVMEYYSYTKELIASGVTNAEGNFNVKLKEKPFLLIAKHGKQRGYLKLQDGNVNSLSKFDVDGEKVQNGIKGFIYGERGVWRPGDSLYLNFILNDKYKSLPKNHPVEFELQDPSGQVVYEVTKTKNVEGTYDFRTKTEQGAMSGNYLAIARVGNSEFTKTIKIETIKPNRLKIDFKVNPTQSADSSATLSVTWLHGAVARDLKSLITVGFQPTTTKFDGFKEYVFDSPLRDFNSDVETMFEGKLNEKGIAHPKTKLNNVFDAPGKLKALYVVKVFEEGGDFSIDRFQSIYSPFKTYIGLKTPAMKSYDQSVETDKIHKFDVVALNEQGKLVHTSNLKVKIYKLNWRWWYEEREDDLMEYVARAGTIAIKDTVIDAVAGKGSFNFRVRNENYGRYLITVSDPAGNHQTGKVLNFDWSYWNRGNRTENEQAKMLSFSSDKKEYTRGEQVKLSFPSPEAGRALVSIENGQRIVQTYWVKTQKGETNFQFETTAAMSPACYVHVTMIQPHIHTKNDLPIRMYGVIPITVDNPATHLNPIILSADVFKPESTSSIQVKEQNGKRMVYTIDVVDNGLLDLTRFSTPQPHGTFYAREALGVKTWDMFDEVIGAYSGRLDNLIGIGGDGFVEPGSGPKANRFKPMIYHLGPFVLEAGQTRAHKIDIPNYIGSVRVMIVAHDNEAAFGNAEKNVFVRKPLMVLTSLPRVLAPGEELNVPVTLFAMEKHVKSVTTTIEANDFFEVLDGTSRTTSFSEIGDQLVYFRVRVKRKAGIGKIKIVAKGNGEVGKDETELDIRPANPPIKEVNSFVVENGKSLNAVLKKIGIAGTNKVVIEVSNSPAIGLEKRLNYLIQYPHGCVEQTTSAAFPQLYVDGVMELNEQQQKQISTNVDAAINRLQGFQISTGGFSYWPGEASENEWATNYVGHFLIEAQAQGYKIPEYMLTNWAEYQKNKAQNWDVAAYNSRPETGEMIQSYRLFVLALNKTPALGAMNRLRERSELSLVSRYRLAAAYQLIGQADIAKKIVSSQTMKFASYQELSGTFGSDFRDKAMVLEALSYLKDKNKTDQLAKEVAESLRSEEWMSTQETAYGLLAMCAYTGKKGSNVKLQFNHTLAGSTAKSVSSLKSISKLAFYENELSAKTNWTLKNLGTGKLFVTITSYGILPEKNQKAKAKGLKMSIRYFDLKGSLINPLKMQQGTEFTAEVTIKNLNKSKYLKELALTQFFPSGWEIHNSRMDEMNYETNARYQDFRDDCVLSYYDLAPAQEKTIRVRLNASFVGKYFLPGIYTEAMYDNSISALLPGKWVEVVK